MVTVVGGALRGAGEAARKYARRVRPNVRGVSYAETAAPVRAQDMVGD